MISGQDQYAYLDLTVTSPDTPIWANAPQYIQAFTVKYTANNGSTGTRTFSASEPLRLDLLITGMSYAIWVSVTDYLGQASDFSSPITYSTIADMTPPAAPTIAVTVLGSGALITVAQLNTEPDFAGYDLYRDTNSALKSEPTLLPCAHFNGAQYVDQSLPSDGAYYYFLRAKDVSGNTQDSAVVGPTTLSASGSQTPPPAISLTGATAVANTDGTITFSFETPVDSNLKHYNIWRKRTGGSWLLLDTVVPLVAGSSFSYVDLDTVNGSEYAYSASAVDANNTESVFDAAGQVTATANDTTPPLPIPNSIQYLGQLGCIQVTWQASPDPSTQFYLVQWRYAQIGAYSTFNAGILVEGTSYTIHGLIDPTTGLVPSRDSLSGLFEVEIAAVDTSNNESTFVSSGPAQFPQLAGYRAADNSVPPAPALSTPVINNDGSITISWLAPTISDLYGYIVEELETGGLDWEQIQTIQDSSPGPKQFSATGLDPYNFDQVQYRFRVRTLDNSQNVSGANLLDDPSFTLETWGFSNAPTYVTPGRNTSGQAVRASANTGMTQTVPVSQGTLYSVSGYCAQDVTTGLSCLIEVHWLAANGSEISVSSGTPLALGVAYQQWTNTALLPPAFAVSAKLVLISDSVNRNATALWDDIQFEEGPRVTPYGDGKTVWLNASDTAAPPVYTSQFQATGQWGYFDLNWVNGTDPAYVNCVYEIWRQRLASDAPGFVADPAFVKVVEIPGHKDGKANHWSDDIPNENEHLQVQYGLRPRDRFGNAAVDSGGNPVFLATSATVTSLNTNDKNIGTATAVQTAQTTADTANAAAATAAANATAAQATATSALGLVTVVAALPVPVYAAGKFVYLNQNVGSTLKGLYVSDGNTWSREAISTTQLADQIIAGQIAAGAVTTNALATAGISVGGGGGKPGQFSVYDGAGNLIGFIGGAGGAWFKTAGVGGTSGSPALLADASGNLTMKGQLYSSSGLIQAIDTNGNIKLKNVLWQGTDAGFYAAQVFSAASGGGWLAYVNPSITVTGANPLLIIINFDVALTGIAHALISPSAAFELQRDMVPSSTFGTTLAISTVGVSSYDTQSFTHCTLTALDAPAFGLTAGLHNYNVNCAYFPGVTGANLQISNRMVQIVELG